MFNRLDPYSKAKYDTMNTLIYAHNGLLDPYSKAKYDTMGF